MVSRFLVTTALEETWPDSGPVLFLGEWCRIFERRNRWAAMDAVVLPYHWDDRAKAQRDYDHLLELNERLLEELSATLNELHGVRRSLRHWRILVGPWLGHFAQMLFDRWESIRIALAQHEVDATVVLTGAESRLVPADMAQFTWLHQGDEWNHHIYGRILRRIGAPVIEKQTPLSAAVPNSGSEEWPARVKNVVVSAAAFAARRLVRKSDVCAVDTYLPVRRQLGLHLLESRG